MGTQTFNLMQPAGVNSTERGVFTLLLHFDLLLSAEIDQKPENKGSIDTVQLYRAVWQGVE